MVHTVMCNSTLGASHARFSLCLPTRWVMYLNNCTSVDYMRKRINYETSNNAIITLDPIEIFIYVIMIVCGRLRNPGNNFLLMYCTCESVSRCGFWRKQRAFAVQHYAYERSRVAQEVFFPFVIFGKKRVLVSRAPLPRLGDISSFSELNGSVKWNKGDFHVQTHVYTIYTLDLDFSFHVESRGWIMSLKFLSLSSFPLILWLSAVFTTVIFSSLSLAPVFSSLYFSSVRSGETFFAESQCRRMRLIKFSDQVTHIEF